MSDDNLNKNDPNILDRALLDPDDDLLERGPFVDGLVRALVKDVVDETDTIIGRRSSGFVIGLTGDWGLGKSTILNFTEAKLKQLKYVSVAQFNPWIFNGRDELLNGFFHALRGALGKSRKDQARELQASLDKYWNAIEVFGDGIAATADAHGGAGIAGKVWNWIKKLWPGGPDLPTPHEERKELERKLKKANQAVVVLIDELDRVEDDEVRAVAQLVKAVGDIEGISYLVSYEPKRVVEALGRGNSKKERTKTGERYLEKIIQYPVPVRPLFTNDAKLLLEATLNANDNSDFDWGSLIEDPIFKWILGQISTPREVKRLIGSYTILYDMVRGEIETLDVLAYCWILTKSPSLRDAISENIDEMVEDPAPEYMSARIVAHMDDRDSKPSSVEVLGESAKPFEEIIGLLFPRFGEDRKRDGFDGTRISRRQNLVRLLYLGNPPDLIPRARVEELWATGQEHELETGLRNLLSSGMLRTFVDRLDDLFDTLPREHDLIFWQNLARVLVRDSDWIASPDNLSSIASDAGDALLRMASRDKETISRVRGIFAHLIDQGDLILVPHMLRKLLFHYGMTKHSTRERQDDWFFTKSEVEAFLDGEIARYREAILEGFALRRLPTVQAIFAIGNSERWDEELRQNLTGQLSTKEALSTFAALVVPPGYSIDRSSLDELFVADQVQQILEGFGDPSEWIDDPWVASSVRRLLAVFHGRDTMWMGEDED